MTTIRAIHPHTLHLDGGALPSGKRLPGELAALASDRTVVCITAYRVELADGTLLSVADSRRLFYTSAQAKQAILFAQRQESEHAQ